MLNFTVIEFSPLLAEPILEHLNKLLKVMIFESLFNGTSLSSGKALISEIETDNFKLQFC